MTTKEIKQKQLPPTDHAWLPSIFSVEEIEEKDSDELRKKLNKLNPKDRVVVGKKKKDNIIFCVPCTQRFILRPITNDKQICPHVIQKVN